jgi:hypothetical protein|eukprot:CAMPEP_0169097966 /NCGR_PEP_ID=MMETSP1015-20121227/19791_1 /TAXON_ID=342587 /ORGANISM="Karlodinium micrum, Strain CCMP2283" /LENGTH=368 /DNA_ID=CAMNT_0009158787 /DNA_START=51 /DNA_END=1157 /DNA_ORIENTATION=-
MAFLHTSPPQKAEGMNAEQKFGFFFGPTYTKAGFADISSPGTGTTTPDCLDTREDVISLQDSSSGMSTPPDFEKPPILPLGVPPGLAVPEMGDSIVTTSARPPSLGSIGHPECCAEACKYIKRKGGCRHGESCPQCHLCFWQRTPAQAPQHQKDVPPINCVAAYSSKSDSLEPKESEKAKTENSSSDEDRMSIGSLNHPVGCAAPCRYVNRKGGCRNGKTCPECHFCHWRRNLAPKANPESVDNGNNNAGSISTPFGLDATQHLQQLIYLQLACASNPSRPTVSNPTSKQCAKSEFSAAASIARRGSASLHSSLDYSCSEAQAMHGSLLAPPQAIAPPPGLEHENPRFFSLNARFLSGQSPVGTVSPR